MKEPDTTPSRRQTITLARLSFDVPPERMAEFGSVYEEKVVPVLKRYGLVASAECGRATLEGVFRRLFEFKTPSDWTEAREKLQKDSAWQSVLLDLGAAFGTPRTDGLILHGLRIYATPAGPGKEAPAGSGRVESAGRGTGHWRTYDVTDGLGGGTVLSIFQGREGDLWFGTGGGVSRYNGHEFITFTTKDGLAGNDVSSILQDQGGRLWFGTYDGGVSRYDGRKFRSFTTKDGLPENWVWSIIQDWEGYFWIGTRFGVSRYDGRTFTTFTTKDGLADNAVSSILQDREGHLWFGTDGGVSQYDGQTFTTFTTQDGLGHNEICSIFRDREGNLWFGTWGGGVSRYDGQTFTTFTAQDGLADNRVWSILQDREENLWFGTWGGVSQYDGKAFTTFTTQDGLAGNVVVSSFQDGEGHFWFGTGIQGAGMSRYDGQIFTTFTTQDGLGHNEICSIFRDREGNLWFGTWGGGVSRYDGQTFTTFTTQDGLVDNVVWSIIQDQEGHFWFGTNDGVSRYDGQTFTTFTTQDGLVANYIRSITQDREGNLWFGTFGAGVSRYDGKTFITFTTDDGLPHNIVESITQDREENLWFGTQGGVGRYDGKRWTTLTMEDGLVHNIVMAMLQDREGNLWFSTQGGLSRYNGKTFTTFTTDDGLAGDNICSSFQDRDGHLWFGIDGGGVCRYDGQVFQALIQQDGLASNVVRPILQDADGALWFGTNKGVTRYHTPAPSPPPVSIDAVVGDRRYEGEDDLEIASSVGLIAFEFDGISFKTRPRALVYRYRLTGFDKDWKTTSEHRVEYLGLPIGTYTFEVQAVDRDLVYSEEPATVHLTVVRDTRDEQIDELEARVRERTQELEETHRELQEAQAQLIAELEEELQTAHDMQMGLMPTEPPRIEGFDIAGRCIPANHVGGDFFQYFQQDSKLILALADVTGHAMEAAIPVVMFSGILDSQMELGGSVEDLFGRLNRSLYRNLDRRTFVCFTMGELDPGSRRFHLSNGGCPYPYHFRASTRELVELQMDAYPLGVRADTAYEIVETRLQSEDRVVFCSDGIIEAENASDEQFGYERMGETICKACEEGLPAEATIDRILEVVGAFKGDAPQSDDMTCVVVRVE